MTIASVNGVELYYETAGAGERIVLTHGSWGDARNWAAVVGPLAERFEVVTWDRRGHSRSQDGPSPGSLIEDAADLAALIEHVGGNTPVHLVGNSFGASITLTLLTARPELAASVVVHEPPLFALLEGTTDEALAAALASMEHNLDAVTDLLAAGDHPTAAQRFVEDIAFGPGAWEQLPATLRQIFVANAPTFLDERRDPNSLSIDSSALASTTTTPMLLTRGTESPVWLPAVVAELGTLLPHARVEELVGAGHVPTPPIPSCGCRRRSPSTTGCLFPSAHDREGTPSRRTPSVSLTCDVRCDSPNRFGDLLAKCATPGCHRTSDRWGPANAPERWVGGIPAGREDRLPTPTETGRPARLRHRCSAKERAATIRCADGTELGRSGRCRAPVTGRPEMSPDPALGRVEPDLDTALAAGKVLMDGSPRAPVGGLIRFDRIMGWRSPKQPQAEPGHQFSAG
ncbi:MAG: alpha/beta fold hydrolase [Acidimicrobiales bacterium]